MGDADAGRADIIVGAMRAPPPDTGFGFARLGDLELVFAVAPHHPLVHEEEPLSRQTIKRFRAIVVGDSVHSSRSIGSELLDAQEAITVFDFKPSWSCKLAAWMRLFTALSGAAIFGKRRAYREESCGANRL